ncbi:MAG TPA: hypothetical protein VNH11_10050, partial [Pirellulales bacterium]|nr:hypothetical protein [Pirellulales bacterium]
SLAKWRLALRSSRRPGDAPVGRTWASLGRHAVDGASRYQAKLCPSHRFSSRQNVSFSAA